jgi:hypothetical protein
LLCPDCLLPAVLSQLSCSCCHILAVLGCPCMAVLSVS